jgi:hypothetical protein
MSHLATPNRKATDQQTSNLPTSQAGKLALFLIGIDSHPDNILASESWVLSIDLKHSIGCFEEVFILSVGA